jgi:hypothetical protein
VTNLRLRAYRSADRTWRPEKSLIATIRSPFDRRGIDRPEPVPHPDGVVIDYKTGDVRIEGPVMTEQKQAKGNSNFLREGA